MFDAPRELFWKAFTDPERMKQSVHAEGIHRPGGEMDLRRVALITIAWSRPDGKRCGARPLIARSRR